MTFLYLQKRKVLQQSEAPSSPVNPSPKTGQLHSFTQGLEQHCLPDGRALASDTVEPTIPLQLEEEEEEEEEGNER